MKDIYNIIRDDYLKHKYSYIQNKNQIPDCNEWQKWIYSYVRSMNINDQLEIISRYGLGRFLMQLPTISQNNFYMTYDELINNSLVTDIYYQNYYAQKCNEKFLIETIMINLIKEDIIPELNECY